MTALQRILDRMPSDEHRNSFQRLINEAGMKEDSPDMVFLALDHEAHWAAVQAMGEERERIKKLLDELPAALREAGVEITRTLASDIGAEASKKLTEDAKQAYRDEITAQAKDLKSLMLEIVAKFSGRADELMQRTELAITKTAGIPGQALAQIATVKPLVAEVKDVLRGYFYVFVFVPVLAIVIGFIAGGIFDYSRMHTSTYQAGWNAGAYAVRAHPGQPR